MHECLENSPVLISSSGCLTNSWPTSLPFLVTGLQVAQLLGTWLLTKHFPLEGLGVCEGMVKEQLDLGDHVWWLIVN